MAARQEHPPGRATRHPPHPPHSESTHPAQVAAVLVAALCVVAAVTTPIDDPDLWQHLLVGKAIWTTHAIPGTHQWTWPRVGESEPLPSWGFRFLLWPVWQAGGAWGLEVWRWLTTLAAFALVWRTARGMKAAPFVTLAVVVWCALIYRQRSMVRPDTLVAILLAAELWLLERRRHGDRVTLPLVLIAFVWVNVHVSYFIGLLVLAIDALAERLARPERAAGDRRPARERAWPALLGAALVSFANPFGWDAVREPFRFLLQDRGTLLFASIPELQPIDWSTNLHHGLPALMLLWPLLILTQLSRRPLGEATLCVLFTTLAVTSQRFVGTYVIVAAPFVARGLTVALAPLLAAAPGPGWRFGAVAAASVVATAAVCAHPAARFGFGLVSTYQPAGACDFIERQRVSGRGFNYFDQGGYQAWRFWPDRGRLPFMDIHQSGTAADRALYAACRTDAAAWRALDAARRFDYLILRLPQTEREILHDVVESDSTWALVFLDDAAALHLRRSGPLQATIDSFDFHRLATGRVRMEALARTCQADAATRDATVRELERVIAGSADHSQALSLLANLRAQGGDLAGAETLLRRLLATWPDFPAARLRLGWIALELGRPAEALAVLKRGAQDRAGDRDATMGRAYGALGDRTAAAHWYRRALRRDPANQVARDSLLALGEPLK